MIGCAASWRRSSNGRSGSAGPQQLSKGANDGTTVAGLLIERPTPRGVSRIYGYLGDGIVGITATPLRNEGHNDLAAHSAAVVQAIEVGIQALHLGSPSD